MTVRFEIVTRIAAPPEAVFDLSLDIDAHLASIAGSDERAVAGVTSGQIGLGEDVTWVARHFGIPWRMTSRVVELERPVRFVDEQQRGPFARFRHEHRFEPTSAGTTMTDTVEFDAPFGPLGRLVERLVLARYMAKLIKLRGDHLRRCAEGDISTS